MVQSYMAVASTIISVDRSSASNADNTVTCRLHALRKKNQCVESAVEDIIIKNIQNRPANALSARGPTRYGIKYVWSKREK